MTLSIAFTIFVVIFWIVFVLTGLRVIWATVWPIYGWFFGIRRNVVADESEVEFLRLVQEMQDLADLPSCFVGADEREVDDEPVEEHLRSLYSKEKLRPRRFPFAVRLAMHLKGEFTLLSNTQANRLVLRKAAVDFCRGKNVRRQHIALCVPLAVELALIPLKSDLLTRQGGMSYAAHHSRRQVSGPIWHRDRSGSLLYYLFGFAPFVRSKEAEK
jgi:hypothetical protein